MTATTLPAAPAPSGAGAFVHARHLLGLERMPRETLVSLLESAQSYREQLDAGGIRSHELEGITVCNAFFENSTRTRVSFELAARRLGATCVTFSTTDSSTSKGETLLDTLKVIESMRVDLIVIRHAASGTPAYLARNLEAGVINAGDGQHEHPTQGLLDLLTLRQSWGGEFAGKRVALVGDIAHSRVARSAIHGLVTLGASVVLAGPPTLIPQGIETLGPEVAPTVEDAMRNADAVMALRVQQERMGQGLLASMAEYARTWAINARRARLMRPDAIVMHPGPMNRGVEIAPDVADGERSVILAQVTNGVAVRCAVLSRCAAALREAA